jgi:hypothetical protein
MQAQRILVAVLMLALLLALSVGSIQAGQPPPPNLTAQDATPLGTAFTYQGHLKQNGNPVNGTCDCQFGLWDALTGGTAVGAPLDRPAVSVTNGLLTIPDLDFGGSAFAGDARWLEVEVRCPAASGSYTTLTPRQALTAAPYALRVKSAPWSGLTGVPAGFADGEDNDTIYTAGAGLTLTGSQFSLTFAGSGSANTAARSDHNHWGQSWTSSSGGAGLSVTNSGTGSGLSGSSNAGYGVYGSSTSGTAGYFQSTGGKAIQADGDVQVTGNLTVTGQISGFPRPNFDSGWVDFAQGATVTITHNLGGNPENYVVDMTFRDYYFGSGIHQITYGGDVRPDEGSKGVWWEALNATSIKVIRAL